MRADEFSQCSGSFVSLSLCREDPHLPELFEGLNFVIADPLFGPFETMPENKEEQLVSLAKAGKNRNQLRPLSFVRKSGAQS